VTIAAIVPNVICQRITVVKHGVTYVTARFATPIYAMWKSLKVVYQNSTSKPDIFKYLVEFRASMLSRSYAISAGV
jgi:hypothetical protein